VIVSRGLGRPGGTLVVVGLGRDAQDPNVLYSDITVEAWLDESKWTGDLESRWTGELAPVERTGALQARPVKVRTTARLVKGRLDSVEHPQGALVDARWTGELPDAVLVILTVKTSGRLLEQRWQAELPDSWAGDFPTRTLEGTLVPSRTTRGSLAGRRWKGSLRGQQVPSRVGGIPARHRQGERAGDPGRS
jgi:hypothetical protein